MDESAPHQKRCGLGFILVASTFALIPFKETIGFAAADEPLYAPFPGYGYACSVTSEQRAAVREALCDPDAYSVLSSPFSIGFKLSKTDCAKSLLEMASALASTMASRVAYYNACGYSAQTESTRRTSLNFAELFSSLMQVAGLSGDFRSTYLDTYTQELADDAEWTCPPKLLRSSVTNLEYEITMERADSFNEEIEDIAYDILDDLNLRESKTGQIVSLCSPSEALKQVSLLAEQGDADAQYNLGVMYENGQGVPQDDTEAVKWYRLAAERGHAGAQFNLGFAYSNGQGVQQDSQEAVRWYRLAAERGHAGAQNNLGLSYANGKGVSQDYTEAAKWYRSAAERGYATAQHNLARLYQDGIGVPRDYAEALKWYSLAAEQGYANAQNDLGWMYHEGDGVAQDFEEAVKWYRLAAERGHALAQFNLGLAYNNSEGVAQDFEEAVKWYRLAAKQGHDRAQFNLGNMYEAGKGVSQDYKEAVKWYRSAAEQGYPEAQNSLAVMYLRGNGVKKDNVYAYMWIDIAASQGNESARKNREKLAAKMTREEIDNAQANARDCLAKNLKGC